jgi:hypothetical protein
MQSTLDFQYMVEKERSRLQGDPTISRRAIHERELSLAVAVAPDRRPSLSQRVGAVLARTLDGFRPAGMRAGAQQG